RRGGRAAPGGVRQRPRLCGSERGLHLPRGGTGGGGGGRKGERERRAHLLLERPAAGRGQGEV
ncbi:Hypothetical protein EMIHUDRAFT_363204, partial [Emiliania huxleyi CCMP1516]|uniref:Uncharacterized protein n=2 Tax=Emiliania huxleyi TaxID=2903 RepID=A0A0D3KGS1_EMIH1